jgi:hypothetical protein
VQQLALSLARQRLAHQVRRYAIEHLAARGRVVSAELDDELANTRLDRARSVR